MCIQNIGKNSLNTQSLIINTKSLKSTRTIFSVTVTIILFIGVALNLLNVIPTAGLIITILGVFLGLLYTIFTEGIVKSDRIIITIMSVVVLVNLLFKILHLPGARFTHMALVIPIGLFIFISFRSRSKLYTEYPFVALIAIIALLSFLR